MGWLALAGVQAIATIAEGEAAKSQYESEAEAQEMQARIDENESRQVQARGALEQRRMAEEHQAGQSLMLANISKSGAIPTAGAGLLAQAHQQTQFELDRLIQSHNVNEAVKSKLYEAEVARHNAKMAKRSGKSAQRLGYIKAGTGLIISGFQNRTPTGGGTTGSMQSGTAMSHATTGSGAYGGTMGGGPTGGYSRSFL